MRTTGSWSFWAFEAAFRAQRKFARRGVDGLIQRMYLTDKLFNHTVQKDMSTDRLSTTLAALADPTRRAILARLAMGETSVTELAGPFAMSLPAVSKHLKVLERAGLITRGREAQWRPCRLEAAPLKDVDGWLENYRQFWDESLDRLEVYLQKLQQGGPDGSKH